MSTAAPSITLNADDPLACRALAHYIKLLQEKRDAYGDRPGGEALQAQLDEVTEQYFTWHRWAVEHPEQVDPRRLPAPPEKKAA